MGFFDKMFSGLSKTRKNIEDLEEIFQNYDLDDMDFYDGLEEMLVMADVGGETTAKILYDYKRILYRNRINKGRDAKKAFVSYMHDMLGEMDTSLKLETALGYPYGRRKRRRQNNDHRQALGKTESRRQKGAFMRGRHIPCCRR